jgi:arsenite-transporting ATPase
MRLQSDLRRAGIHSKWWAINSSFYAANTTNAILKVKASNEVQWINKVNEISKGNFAVVEWMPEEVKGEKLKELIK